jgi:outer membrane protein OmpA-like peptidoglycan-associated protein
LLNLENTMTTVGCVVPFTTGSARLSNSAKEAVKRSIGVLNGTETILLDAYADPPGSRGLNTALTVSRAEAVKSFVVGLGFPPHKIKTRARGEGRYERPGLSDRPDELRRVELLILN